MRGDFRQSRQAARVPLYGDDLRPRREQGAGKAAGAGADLDHGHVVERTGGAGDAAGEVEIVEEILSERLLGGELVRGDDFAKRRQTVGGEAHALSRAARSSAATRLVQSASPRPAMSKAVPWSGEVRTKGRPSVTFTPSSKASVLAGIRPWS